MTINDIDINTYKTHDFINSLEDLCGKIVLVVVPNELYSNKTGTISDMCTCMYTSINCGYKLYVLDLSLDNSSSSSTYDGIQRNDRTTLSGCLTLQSNSSPLILIPLCSVWAFPAKSSVMSYDKPSSTFGTTTKTILPHKSSRELIKSCVLYVFIQFIDVYIQVHMLLMVPILN
jgi:hypothetical protein